MSTVQTQPGAVPITVDGTWEPSLTATFLPRCANCHAPHPMARGPLSTPLDDCPDCGYPVGKSYSREVPASLGGFWGWVASIFLNIGRALKRLSREV